MASTLVLLNFGFSLNLQLNTRLFPPYYTFYQGFYTLISHTSMSMTDSNRNETRAVNRRKYLKTVGGAGLLLAGTASASTSQRTNEARHSQRTIEARQRFFGDDNVNPQTGEVRRDRVILSWFGVSSFAAAIRGHVVLLDAWVLKGWENAPTTVEEVAALRPEAIFVGHANFDHAADIGELVRRTGATVVGTPKQCEFARDQAGDDVSVECVEAVPPGVAPGASAELSFLSGVGISAVKHLHSDAEIPDPSEPRVPCAPATMPPTTRPRHLRSGRTSSRTLAILNMGTCSTSSGSGTSRSLGTTRQDPSTGMRLR